MRSPSSFVSLVLVGIVTLSMAFNNGHVGRVVVVVDNTNNNRRSSMCRPQDDQTAARPRTTSFFRKNNQGDRIGRSSPTTTVLCMSTPGGSSSSSNQEEGGSERDGAELAAELFKMAQQKGIKLSSEDMLLDDEEDDEDVDDDEGEVNIPQGAINAFLGYDTGNVGEKLAGNVSLTDNQLYSEMRDRVLDTAGGFVELTRAPSDDEEEDDEEEYGDESSSSSTKKQYEAPTTVPDPELTAGEVVNLVLEAMLNNDVPTKNRGVEILFGYSSPGSQIKTEENLTPDDYADYLKDSEYKVLFQHMGATIEKGDYSIEGKKAFFTARLQVGPGPRDIVSVNFILSPSGTIDEEDSCWLIDSMLIRPQSMQRRRRR